MHEGNSPFHCPLFPQVRVFTPSNLYPGMQEKEAVVVTDVTDVEYSTRSKRLRGGFAQTIPEN